jgi:hypothetical protein
MRSSWFLAVGVLAILTAMPLHAEEPRVRFSGFVQFWYLYEQAENGKVQDLTGDLGAQVASGFNLNRARCGVDLDLGAWKAALQVRLEGGSVGLLDAYGSWQPSGPALLLLVGQMKIPSEWEVMVGEDSLAFVTRSRFANEVANWSLSKSPASTSPFTFVQTYARDMGVGLQGSLRGFHYFAMVGNGLGANNYVGAEESRQFVYANQFGAYFYGARISYEVIREPGESALPGLSSLEIGGHFNYNHHPNLIYNDAKTVLDLERWSWSVDARLELLERIRIITMYGSGKVEDDFDADGQPDYLYSGWEAGAVVQAIPGLLEAGVRWDSYTWSRAVTSGSSTAGALTTGVSWSPLPYLRVQLNYKWKILDSELDLDTDNDFAVLSLQLGF